MVYPYGPTVLHPRCETDRPLALCTHSYQCEWAILHDKNLVIGVLGLCAAVPCQQRVVPKWVDSAGGRWVGNFQTLGEASKVTLSSTDARGTLAK